MYSHCITLGAVAISEKVYEGIAGKQRLFSATAYIPAVEHVSFYAVLSLTILGIVTVNINIAGKNRL